MFTFLIPLYYLVSKLAEEKESKLREGMKMMGLKDFTYYLSWFIFYFTVITIMSIVMAMIVGYSVFQQSNTFLLFLLSFLYGLSTFGFSILIVALVPS
jgi:ATP-binding cassette subfamily A (ABC1) protein 3